MNMFEDFSKFDVYDKNNGNNKDNDDNNKDNKGDDVEDYTYTIVSTNENYVFKVSLYSHTTQPHHTATPHSHRVVFKKN